MNCVGEYNKGPTVAFVGGWCTGVRAQIPIITTNTFYIGSVSSLFPVSNVE